MTELKKKCPVCGKIIRATKLLAQLKLDGEKHDVFQLDLHRRGSGYCKQLNMPIYEAQ